MSAEKQTVLRTEPMKQGLLVIGTDQIAAAGAYARDRNLLPEHWNSTESGRYRKVPGQWSNWELHKLAETDNPRGSFLAVAFYFDRASFEASTHAFGSSSSPTPTDQTDAERILGSVLTAKQKAVTDGVITSAGELAGP